MNSLSFWLFFVVMLANFIVGTSIGISGIGGFFLPIVYTTILGMDVRDALLLSFFAFLLSGLLGSFRYAKLGYIRKPFALRLGIGCILGAVVGVRINFLLPADFVKGLLYLVVLTAGISLLLKIKEKDTASSYLGSPVIIVLLGLVTGILCSMSGAGGALILVPVLVALGEKTKYAVGMGILGSVFISIPSSIGYFVGSDLDGTILILLVSLVSHGVGVRVGSQYIQEINQDYLRKAIAYLSISSALFLFARLFSLGQILTRIW